MIGEPSSRARWGSISSGLSGAFDSLAGDGPHPNGPHSHDPRHADPHSSGPQPCASYQSGPHPNGPELTGLSLPSMGVDVVDIPAFATQLAQPGTTFEAAFSVLERRHARARREQQGEAAFQRHLAGRWAAKEAILKALEQARYGLPGILPAPFPAHLWPEIEVVPDSRGRVAVRLRGSVRRALDQVSRSAGLPDGVLNLHWALSISHDGAVAVACAQVWQRG